MNSLQLLDFAEMALAGYGQFPVKGRAPLSIELTLLNGSEYGFSLHQAEGFINRFSLANATFEDSKSPGGSGLTSFCPTTF